MVSRRRPPTFETLDASFEAIGRCTRGELLLHFPDEGNLIPCSISMLQTCQSFHSCINTSLDQPLELQIEGGSKTFAILQRYVEGENMQVTVDAALDLLPAMQTLGCPLLPLAGDWRRLIQSSLLGGSWRDSLHAVVGRRGRLRKPDMVCVTALCRKQFVDFLGSVSDVEEVLEFFDRLLHFTQTQLSEFICLLRLPEPEVAAQKLALSETVLEGLAQIFRRNIQWQSPNKARLLELLGDLMRHAHPRPYTGSVSYVQDLATFLSVALAPLREARPELVEIYSRVFSEMEAREMAMLNPGTILDMVKAWNELDKSTPCVDVFAAVKRYVDYMLENHDHDIGRNKHFREVAHSVNIACSSSVDSYVRSRDSLQRSVKAETQWAETEGTSKKIIRKLKYGPHSGRKKKTRLRTTKTV